MLFLAAAALIMPAIYELVEGKGLPGVTDELVNYGGTVEKLSLAVAGVLLVTYVIGLFFSLRTHKDVFNAVADDEEDDEDDAERDESDEKVVDEDAPPIDPYIERLAGSVRRAKEIPEIAKFLPPFL